MSFSKSDWFNIISTVISAFAFAFSMYAIYKGDKVAKKEFSNNYFHIIFDDIIVFKYPALLSDVINNSGQQLKDKCEQFADVTNDLMEKVFFYKFFDNMYYEQLKQSITVIENYSLQIMSSHSGNCQQIKEQLDMEFGKLYKLMGKYYLDV